MSNVDLWQTLRLGDHIKIVRMPSEFSLPGYPLFDCTRQIYQKLIDGQNVLEVSIIDDFGCPWIECVTAGEHGEEYHSLMINHDGLEFVTDFDS